MRLWKDKVEVRIRLVNIAKARAQPNLEKGSKAGAEKFAKGLLESQLANGWNSEVKVEGGKVTLINHTCPCYSGMREAGLTHEQTRNMCYAWWRRFPESAKKENSSVVGYPIEKYRDNESGICHEVFEFKK